MPRTLFILFLVISSQPAHAQTVEDQLRELRTEVQRLRQELDEVKQELQNRDQSADVVPLLQAQIQEQAQTKVETTSKFPLKIFGTVVSNTFLNTGEPNWLDIPNIATRPPSGKPGACARSTRTGSRRSRT